jgi:GNAT superfamily N-acetyltransferase
MNKESFNIRNASLDDISDIYKLSQELGYINSEYEIRERLNYILNSNEHLVVVAFLSDRKVVGWIHLFEAQRIESGKFAEICGFVVKKEYRNIGIGKKLLKAAEEWTLKKKLPKLRIRSKIEREDAKKFYSKMGFLITKKQRVFDKKI